MIESLRTKRDLGHGGPDLRAAIWDILKRPEMTAIGMMVLVAGYLSLANTTFRSIENVVWVLHSLSVVAIASMGMLLLFILGVIDLSCGAQMGMAAVVTGAVARRYAGSPAWLVLAAALSAGALFGLGNYVLCGRLKLNPFIATLAMGYVGRGLGGVVAGKVILPVVTSRFTQATTSVPRATSFASPSLCWRKMMV